MIHHTTISLSEHANNIVTKEIEKGQFSNPSEVVQAALLLLEKQAFAQKELLAELEEGERSGFVQDFDRHQFLEQLHKKQSNNVI